MAEAGGSGEGERCSLLTCEQVRRLQQVLTEEVPVHGRGNFPTLGVCLQAVVCAVRAGLQRRGVGVKDVRLNGSTASHVLVEDPAWSYKDLDLIFRLDLPHEAGFLPHEAEFGHQEAGFNPQEAGFHHQEAGFGHHEAGFNPQEAGFLPQEAGFGGQEAGFERVREAVLSALLDFLPSGVSRDKMSAVTLTEAYVQKLVKVSTETDRWSLISLRNRAGRNVELKFVERIRRQFEFSVDSFQIVLDPVLERAAPGAAPAVVVESVYGDFAEALEHLRDRLIATRRPEQIRGGGLLKFCRLLTRGFRPARPAETGALQRYMTSRFFIDFPRLPQQRRQLHAYLSSRFAGEESHRYAYLSVLRHVVAQSTVCLMGHERRQVLRLISLMALHALAEQSHVPDASSVTCYYQPAPYAQDTRFCPYYCGHTPAWQPCS